MNGDYASDFGIVPFFIRCKSAKLINSVNNV